MPDKETILIVDDDPFILKIIEETLKSERYNVITATDGQEAIEKASGEKPHLIIMDYMMPKLDGCEVLQKIRGVPELIHVPVIMLTALGSTEDKVRMLERGVDDYLVKPFEPKELIARVKVVLRRTYQTALDINQLTKLPSSASINKEIETRIKNKEKLGICYIDLANFKAFNDRYGFEHGNRLIKEVAHLVKRVAEDLNLAHFFLGHIGGDDFVGITSSEYVDRFCSEVINRFDFFILNFYNPEDQKKGYILTKDRRGFMTRFPIMRIRIAVVTNKYKSLVSLAQISTIVAELKEKTKMFDQSNYVEDERAQ